MVRYSARQKALQHRADFWDHATLLEVAVLENDADAAWVAFTHAIDARPEPWQAQSTLDTLVRLRRARERTEAVTGLGARGRGRTGRVASAAHADDR